MGENKIPGKTLTTISDTLINDIYINSLCNRNLKPEIVRDSGGKMLLCNCRPSPMIHSSPKIFIASSTSLYRPLFTTVKSMATDRVTATSTSSPPRRAMSSASEARVSLVFALVSQASNVSQRCNVMNFLCIPSISRSDCFSNHS